MELNSALLYFAGYIDGDGHFSIQIVDRKRLRNGKSFISKEYICQIAISGKQLDCLQFFKKIFGGSLIQTKKIDNQATCYFYRLPINNRNHLERLKDFLIEKKEQAKICMQFKNSPTNLRSQLIDDIKFSRHMFKATPEFKSKALALRNTITPTIADYIYLAGFIDAECCIQINKKRDKKSFSYKAKLRCGNTKTPVIEWMISRFGGNVFFYKTTKNNHSDIIDYHLEGPKLYDILKNVLPFLIHKGPQCVQAMRLLNLIANRKIPNSNGFLEWKSYSDCIKEEIYHNVKILNSKGS